MILKMNIKRPSKTEMPKREAYHFNDLLGIFIVLCHAIYLFLVMATIQHGPQHTKLKTDHTLGMVDFCCKSLSLIVKR